MVLYLAASPIASFYKDNSLIPVIRVLGLVIIISGLKNVQQAYVSKTLQFKKLDVYKRQILERMKVLLMLLILSKRLSSISIEK